MLVFGIFLSIGTRIGIKIITVIYIAWCIDLMFRFKCTYICVMYILYVLYTTFYILHCHILSWIYSTSALYYDKNGNKDYKPDGRWNANGEMVPEICQDGADWVEEGNSSTCWPNLHIPGHLRSHLLPVIIWLDKPN